MKGSERPRQRLIAVVLLQAFVTITLMPSPETQFVSLCGIIVILPIAILAALLFKLNDFKLQALIVLFSIGMWSGIWIFMG